MAFYAMEWTPRPLLESRHTIDNYISLSKNLHLHL